MRDRQKSDQVSRVLLELILKEKDPCFLLYPVLEFIRKVDDEGIVSHYSFAIFELWLNQFSGLSSEENLYIRGKIAGKWIPREEYQVLFPIGMGKMYEGSHFVTAHTSPDLDTTIASFWGWLDAFAARVGTGLHIWNVPGGMPDSQIEIDMIFTGIFGPGVASHLVRKKTLLSLSSNDLVTQKNMMKKKVTEAITHIHHERDKNAVVITGEDGSYVGDFRSADFEGVRQVISLFTNCLRWFENHLHVHLITLFAKPTLTIDELTSWANDIFCLEIGECEPALEYSSKDLGYLSAFVVKVLAASKGLQTTFQELAEALGELDISSFRDLATAIKEAHFFDKKGRLIENRPRIFLQLKTLIQQLHEAVGQVRSYLERLDVAMNIKSHVLGYASKFVTVRADVEEIKAKMESRNYLTVTYLDKGEYFPLGVIHAFDLHKNTLGTVSLRDFCNREEVGIPPYLEVISVVDHHKSSLHTLSPPLAIIADAQSSNVLLAELALRLNQRFSTYGMSLDEVNKKIAQTPKDNYTQIHLLYFKNLLEQKKDFFIHPEREFAEYLHFLYGILDDTDLLSKVSNRDVECVAHLLNKMKSIIERKPVEILSFAALTQDEKFAKNVARMILQNEDMYSLYKKVYLYREKEAQKNILLAGKGKASTFFLDTKEQNGCCRVGQTKVFAVNYSTFSKHRKTILSHWIHTIEEFYKDRPQYDLYLHMISTVKSATEVYKGIHQKYSHKDELWIWIPSTEIAIEHLKHFLIAFQECPQMKQNELSLEFLGSNAAMFQQVFSESFLEIKRTGISMGVPVAILYYQAGSLNSRKAMVSPYLPLQDN